VSSAVAARLRVADYPSPGATPTTGAFRCCPAIEP